MVGDLVIRWRGGGDKYIQRSIKNCRELNAVSVCGVTSPELLVTGLAHRTHTPLNLVRADFAANHRRVVFLSNSFGLDRDLSCALSLVTVTPERFALAPWRAAPTTPPTTHARRRVPSPIDRLEPVHDFTFGPLRAPD